MHHTPYDYRKEKNSKWYYFTSGGKRLIRKAVYTSATIYFYGSTKRRTALYNRMIRTYYQAFSECFIITASVKTKNGIEEVPFDPSSTQLYLGFYIKRIN